jgi:CHC2-type zinc finger protein
MTAGDSPLQAAKESLSIPALWHLLNLAGKPAKSCRSPFRHERHPSFSVFADGRRFHDFTTGQGGDAADFVAFAYSLSAEEGARRLIEMAGVLPRPNERANPGNFVRLSRDVRLPRDDDAEREAERAGCRNSTNRRKRKSKPLRSCAGFPSRVSPLRRREACYGARTRERDGRGLLRIVGAGTRKLDGWMVNPGRASAIRRRGRCPGVKQSGR